MRPPRCSRARQTSPSGIAQGGPIAIRCRDDGQLDQRDIPLDILLIATDSELKRIYQHNWKQLCGRLAAKNGTLEACRKQVRNSADVIDMDVHRNQCSYGVQRKVHMQSISPGLPAPEVSAPWNRPQSIR